MKYVFLLYEYKTQMYRRYKYTCTHMHASVEHEGDKKKMRTSLVAQGRMYL
jgi:hypothetical protein